jgi:hypothetical protein
VAHLRIIVDDQATRCCAIRGGQSHDAKVIEL